MNFYDALRTILLQPDKGGLIFAKKHANEILDGQIESDADLCVAIMQIQGNLGSWNSGTARQVKKALSEFQYSITAKMAA